MPKTEAEKALECSMWGHVYQRTITDTGNNTCYHCGWVRPDMRAAVEAWFDEKNKSHQSRED